MLSVISNSALVLMKVVVGIMIGSVSVISEAIHSGVDLVASLIALVAVRESGKPADERHPFGHGKVENVSGTIEALLIFLAAGWIIYEAVHKLLHPEPLVMPGWGVGVMLLSAAANMFVSHRLFEVGEETDSVALQADAVHLRTDVYTSVGVMVGLATIWLGGYLLPGVQLAWIDPAAAIAVALLIIKAAYDLTKVSARDLLDVKLPDDEVQWICEVACEHHPQVRGLHKLRTRKSGADRFVEFHLKVDGSMSVDGSHQITVDIERALRARFNGMSVTIHVEPCSDGCHEACVENCFLSEEERVQMQRESGMG